jgi:hypothetical protein
LVVEALEEQGVFLVQVEHLAQILYSVPSLPQVVVAGQ